MLGALEIKAITRFAAQHRGEWTPTHAAVLGCLLAHHHRRTGQCWPKRKDIAAHCGCSESTVDRAIARLVEWGAIKRQQPRAASSQQFRQAQYTILFELPPIVEKESKVERKSCGDQSSRASKLGGAVRHQVAHGTKEEAIRPKAIRAEAPPSYTQRDFDERDWRKLIREVNSIREANVGSDRRSGDDNFKTACLRAGISVKRGYELWQRMTA